MKQHKKMIQTLLLSATSLFLLSSEVFATAESALKRRGIIVQDKETAKKMVQNPELIQKYKEEVVDHGLHVDPKEFVRQKELNPNAPVVGVGPVIGGHVGGGNPSDVQAQAVVIGRAPNPNELAAAAILYPIHNGFTLLQLQIAVKLRTIGYPNFNAQEFADAEAAVTAGIIVGNMLQRHVQAVEYLRTNPANRLGGPIAPPNLQQVRAAANLLRLGANNFVLADLNAGVHLQTDPGNHLGGAIGAPTLENINAAKRLLAIPVLNFTHDHLEATEYLMTNGGGHGALVAGIVAPTADEINAIVHLQTDPGGAHLGGAIAAPSTNQLTAAMRLMAIPVNNFTLAHLNATIHLQTDPGNHLGGPIAAPSADQINAGRLLITAGHNNITLAQLDGVAHAINQNVAAAVQNLLIAFIVANPANLPVGIAEVTAVNAPMVGTAYRTFTVRWDDPGQNPAAGVFTGNGGQHRIGSTFYITDNQLGQGKYAPFVNRGMGSYLAYENVRNQGGMGGYSTLDAPMHQ
jgi:hypothetical protein